MTKKRMKMRLKLTEQDVIDTWNCRTVMREDMSSLAILMLESYRGTLDYEGETIDDAMSEIEETFNGKYGPLIEGCSLLIEEDGRALSACLITIPAEARVPLLAFSMTHEDFKNQGMATFLLKKSINALLAQGHRELQLVVTSSNVSARHLYEKIGFRAFDRP